MALAALAAMSLTVESVAESSTAVHSKHVLPGLLEPGDGTDLRDDNPFETLANIQESWRRKDHDGPWSAHKLPVLDLEGIEWHNYDLPAALRKTPNVTSQILRDIVSSSIENVQVQAAQEARRKREEEEQRASASTSPKPRLNGDEPYLPIIIPEERPPVPPRQPDTESESEPKSSFDHLAGVRAEAVEAVLSKSRSRNSVSFSNKSDKSLKGNLRRFFSRGSEQSDGAADGTTVAWDPTSSMYKRLPAQSKALGNKATASAKAKKTGTDLVWDPVSSRYKRQPVQTKAQASDPEVTSPQSNKPKGDNPPEQRAELPTVELRTAELPGTEFRTFDFSAAGFRTVELIECVSCLEDFPTSSVVRVPCHSYCFECFAGLISTAVQNEHLWPPKCCLNDIPFRTILRYVPVELQERFKGRSAEWNLPVTERLYCALPDCGMWIKPDQNNNPRERTRRCDRGHWTCTMCRGPQHPNRMCTQDPALLLTNRLAEEQGWKTCAQCNAIVEHKEACRHMTCRCGYQFCYVCGAKWCTCHCTGDMLSKVKVDAEARRREREEQEAKEAAEAEELREILAQIEEFEREEALKAEMLRQEQLRLEEERLQRELVEQVRRESRRRVELEQKFEQLRKDLDLLHELQQVMLVEQHEKDAKTLAQEAHQARRRLEDKQTQERADLETFIEVQMAEKELFFHKEFTARSALEKKLVEEYQSQLEAYWRNKATAAQEIDKAMGPLRDRMAKWYQAWLGWRDAELRAQREKLERQRLVKEELMYSVKARQKDQYEGRETELVKRGVAEQKWMQMVILEREKMLVEMEVGEMEGDADSLFLGGNETGGGGVGAS